jgi:nitric oxide synthase-interacting protein
MTNLLAQRKEIKRLEKVAEQQKEDEEEQKVRDEEEARQRAVADFEAVQMGLEAKHGKGTTVVGREGGKIIVEGDVEGKRGVKRKFEIDEDELRRIASEERGRARIALDQEKKAAKGHLPSFWVPSEAPDSAHKSAGKVKQNPICPSSDPEKPHALSLKTLTAVNFVEDKSEETGKSTRSCPSCKKALSNATKAIVAIPCGHVVCKPCVDKFMKPEHRHHRDAHDAGPDPDTIHCYVCDADLTTRPILKEKSKEGKKHKKDKDKGPLPGLVELRSEGTGFAGGGKNMVKKEGVAFQV